MRVAERLRQTQPLLTAMLFFQILWLIAKWLSGNTSLWLLSRTTSSWRRAPALVVYSVVMYLILNCLPSGLAPSFRRAWANLLQNERRLIIALCLLTLSAGVIYAVYQPIWTDEESLFGASKIVVEEGIVPFFARYLQIPWLGTQHPPLVPLLYGLAMHVFGVELLVIRLVSLLFAVGAILTTYFLGQVLYDRDTGLAAALLLLALPYFLRMGAAARTDMPALFFFALGMLLTLRLLQTPTYVLAVGAGLAIGLGLLCRYTAVFVYPVLLGYALIRGSLGRCKLHLSIVVLVSLTMLAPWLAYAARSGVLAAHIGTIAYAVGIVTTTTGGTAWNPTLGPATRRDLLTGLPSGLGAYNIPLLLLGGAYLLRHKRQSDGFVFLWIAGVSLLLILTQPTTRYLMPIFPALAIVMAQALRVVPEATGRAVLLALLYCGGMLYLYVGQ